MYTICPLKYVFYSVRMLIGNQGKIFLSSLTQRDPSVLPQGRTCFVPPGCRCACRILSTLQTPGVLLFTFMLLSTAYALNSDAKYFFCRVSWSHLLF